MRSGALLVAMLALGLSGVAHAAPAPYQPPRTAWGAPDLEGLWSNAWITTLQRPPRFKTLEIGDAEAAAYEASHDGTPEPARASDVGQAESEWWEMGGRMGRIDGRARTSWIVDPADGRLPYSPAGLAAFQAQARAHMRNVDDPEARPAAERCLMGLGGTSLPPMLNASYGNLLRIVQTKDHVVLVTEMHVGPRIIPLAPDAQEPGPAWSGRSQGRWDGETLVVETTGFHPSAQHRAPSGLYISSAAKVTERFTRVGADEIRYGFTVEDPTVFAQTWRGEMPIIRSKGPMFEFACHEGNYSLPGILGGGREQDRAAAAGQATTAAPAREPPSAPGAAEAGASARAP
jgi:hypothetical protein